MRRFLNLSLVALLAALSGTPAYAQLIGAASGQFLSRGPGAATAALAGSVVSDVTDPTALYWNPAGIAESDGMISGEHLFLIGGARYDFMGLTVPSDFGSFGLGVIQLARDNIVARSSIDDPGYGISNTQSDYMAAFAKNLGEHWSAGLSANILDFNLAGYSNMGWGLIGADLDNFIEPQINLAGTPENYPASLRAGGGLAFQTDSRPEASGLVFHDRATILFSLQRTAGDTRLYPAFGLEYSYQNVLILRAGFNGALAGGVGFQTEDDRFELDYSLENDPLGLNNRFTLAYRFSPKTARSKRREIYSEVLDEEYVRARTRALDLAKRDLLSGQAYFNRQDFKRAKSDFRLAAILNPDDPKIKTAERREIQALKMIQIHDDESRLDGGVRPGEEARDYAALFELAVLRGPRPLKPDEEKKWAEILRRITLNLDPGQYSLLSGQFFDIEATVAHGLADLGLLDEALTLASALKTVASPTTLTAADLLAREIADKAASLQTRFDWIVKDSGTSPDDEAAKTALLVLTAFPGNAKEKNLAKKVIEDFKDRHPLSIAEKFYVKKLYYLAALAFAEQTSQSNGLARKYLDEILADNPADRNAKSLLVELSRTELSRTGLSQTELSPAEPSRNESADKQKGGVNEQKDAK